MASPEDRNILTNPKVLAICTAYESGFGHGLDLRGLQNPYAEGTDEHEAYWFGYRSGMLKKRGESEPEKQS